mgnify:CR=1 FL=1
MPIKVDACVAQHQGDRKEQQDRVALLPPRDGSVEPADWDWRLADATRFK